MTDEKVSARWGRPGWDEEFTQIPNKAFRYYTEAGLSRTEFLVVLHLASYKYESPGAQCKPAISTVAREMGLSARHVRRVLDELESRELLTKTHRDGDTNLYEFGGFCDAVDALVGGRTLKTPDVDDPGHGRPGCEDVGIRGDGTPVSNEEEKENNSSVKSREEQIWLAALGELQLQITKATFYTWVKDTQLVSCQDDVFIIKVPNEHSRDWLESRLLTTIRRTLIGIVGHLVEVKLVVEF